MKQILSGILVILMLISVSGCCNKRNETSQTSISDESTADTDTTVNSSDNNGDLILFSTKDRPVVKTSFGYYIFKFDETRLVDLTVVYEKETPELAQALYDTMMSPEYNRSDFLQIDLNGQYVVCTAKEDSRRYSYLFKMNKLDILNLFYSKNAESES